MEAVHFMFAYFINLLTNYRVILSFWRCGIVLTDNIEHRNVLTLTDLNI